MSLLLVRHASAGDRDTWDGADRERPLDTHGRQQAEALVDVLADWPITQVLSSPARRCLETVAPLARARGLELEIRAELEEERQTTDGAALVRSLLGSGVVVCGHGGLEDGVLARPTPWRKGEVIALAADGSVERTFDVAG